MSKYLYIYRNGRLTRVKQESMATGPYYRWQAKGLDPKRGDRCTLQETRPGWLVRHAETGDLMTAWDTFENNTRVHPDGGPALQLLPNDTEVIIEDPGPTPHKSYGTNLIKRGTSVRVLHPSKSAGKVGLVIKGEYRYQILVPGEEKIIGADRPFLTIINTEFKEIP